MGRYKEQYYDKDDDEWQARAIQGCTTEIKAYTVRAFFANKMREEVELIVGLITEELCADLESARLIDDCRKSFVKLAMQIFDKAEANFAWLRGNDLQLIRDAAYSKASRIDFRKLAKIDIPPEMEQKVREILPIPDNGYNKASPNADYYKAVNEVVERFMGEIVEMKPQPDYETNVNLRNIAEIEVRYTHQMKMLNGKKEAGVKLVWIDAHANCSKRCEPWQGRLYSLDGTSGKSPDGEDYVPIENATEIYTVTKAGRRYRNGCVVGFNCRHKLIDWESGNKPMPIPKSVVDRVRKVEEIQREMEREIRYYKEEAIMFVQMRGSENDASRASAKKAEQLQAKYEDFCRRHHIAFYRERCEVMKGENIYLRTRNSKANRSKS